MKIRDDVNEYGTPVGVFRCDTCGGEFTVCPKPADMSSDDWQNCLSSDCDSYDEGRDADKLFDDGKVIRDGIH